MTTRLVVIDMQHVFADADSPWATPGYADAAAGIERMLPALGADAIFTRFVAPAEPAGAWIPYYRDWPFALVPADDPLYDLTPPFADAASASAASSGTRVETRTTFGKWDTAFASAFAPADTMLLAGVSTDCCVLSTALAAADAGVRVRVVADACAGLSDADHERALAAMALYAPLIEITSVDAVLAAVH